MGDIWRIELGEDSDFLYNVIDLVVGIFDIDYFDCNNLPIALIETAGSLAGIS